MDVERFAKKAGDSIDSAAITIKLELFTRIIEDTRVGNPAHWKSKPPLGYTGGRLKGNWQTTTGTPNYNTIDRIDPEGIATKNEVEANIHANTVDYMTNNLPYAAKYEEIDGMVAKNMARLARIARKVAADVS